MEPQQPTQHSTGTSHKKEIITALSVLILIVVIVGGVILSSKSSSDSTDTASSGSSSTSSSGTASDSNSSTASTTGTYKDGSYTADGGYNSPGGFEELSLKVTITDNKVTDATVTTTPTDNEAREYQSQFLSAYKELVVGKSVDDIKLSRVSGSSLTSNGFNTALSDIKQQANSAS